MSLVVAKKEKNRIYIVSDTKLTYPVEIFPEKKLSSPKEGIIKSTITNPHICISFAGETEGVDDLIKKCRVFKDELDKIKKTIFQFHKAKNAKTEFILCVTHYPFYAIYEIKNLQCKETSSSWIGDDNGFNEFQKYWHDLKVSQPNQDTQYIMEKALESVIESNIALSVNGFVISLSNEKNYFEYKSYISAYMPGRVLTSRISVLTYGTAQEGGYNVHIFPSNRDSSVLAIHIQQGNFGIIYHAKNNDLLRPEIISDVDEFEFAEITKLKYDVVPIGATCSQQKSYFERGNKAFERKDYNLALEYYERGISAKESALLAILNYNKGIALFYLGRHSESMQAFYNAVKLDNSFHNKVVQFMQYRKK